MEIGIAAIAVGAVMLGAVVVLWRREATSARSRQEADDAPLEDLVSRPPTFRVVALGLSGTGKTVLLSSLYHELNFPSPARAYHLETGVADATMLAAIRAKVIDTKADWPTATKPADERAFRLNYVADDAAGHKRTILCMEYLEYAGEILTPGDQEGFENLMKLEVQIRDAHALLGLIDGIQVRRLMRGDPAGYNYFHAVLLPMIGLMQQASCPIQLVVTKWDLLVNLDGSGLWNERREFRRVKDALMAIPQIKALVETRGARRIRFIPVSAVGWHFARLAPDASDDDPPVKVPGAELAPINVDIPLCAVLPDLLEQAEKSLDRPLRRRIAVYVRGGFWQDARSLVALLLNSRVGEVLRGVDGVVVFLEWMVRHTPARWWTRRSVSGDREQERLRGKLIEHMQTRVQMLEHNLPESVP